MKYVNRRVVMMSYELWIMMMMMMASLRLCRFYGGMVDVVVYS